jgi:hypothetical protein
MLGLQADALVMRRLGEPAPSMLLLLLLSLLLPGRRADRGQRAEGRWRL